MPNWREDDLIAYEQRRAKHRPGAGLSDTKPERHKTPALVKAVPRETTSLPQTRVRITGYRIRPLDPDNFAGGTKDCIDGLRHSGLLHGDDPASLVLETQQVKVSKRREQKTVVEIFYP